MTTMEMTWATCRGEQVAHGGSTGRDRGGIWRGKLCQTRIGRGPGAIEGREDGNLHQPLRALSRTGESGRVIGGNNPAATRQPGRCFRIVGQVATA